MILKKRHFLRFTKPSHQPGIKWSIPLKSEFSKHNHGNPTAWINDHLSPVRPYSNRDNADRCVSVLLRVSAVSLSPTPFSWWLLRFLFVRIGEVSPYSGAKELLCLSAYEPFKLHEPGALRRSLRQKPVFLFTVINWGLLKIGNINLRSTFPAVSPSAEERLSFIWRSIRRAPEAQNSISSWMG